MFVAHPQEWVTPVSSLVVSCSVREFDGGRPTHGLDDRFPTVMSFRDGGVPRVGHLLLGALAP